MASKVTYEALAEAVGQSLSDVDENVRSVYKRYSTIPAADREELVEENRDLCADAGDYLGAYIWARILYLLENQE
jgi:hypothetical protein